MTSSIKSFQGRYSLVDGHQMNRNTSLMGIHDPSIVLISRRGAAFSILLAALVGALGFWIGQSTLQSHSLHFPTRTKEQEITFQSDRHYFRTFLYNETFVSVSSEETNMAWDSLFPGKLSKRSMETTFQILKSLQKEWVSSKSQEPIRKALLYRLFINFIVS